MTGSEYIQAQIAEIDAQAAELLRRRRFLQNLQMRGIHPFTDVGVSTGVTPKSEGKLITLRLVFDLLSETKKPAKTRNILNYVQNSLRERQNETTLRSHLRRLREDGHIVYEPNSRTWSLP